MREKIAVERGYFVSEEGFAYNKKGEKVGCKPTKGYLYIRIRIDKVCTNVAVHRLQAYQKYGDLLYQNGIEVRHLDSNVENNSHENIVIGTHQQNMMDIPEQVRVKKALHASSFIRKYDKEKVTEFFEECKSYKKTMEKFSISSKGTLHFILNGKKSKTQKSNTTTW